MIMRNIAITGPTSGIGKESVKGLVSSFDKIYLLARSEAKTKSLIDTFSEKDRSKFFFIHLDLADMDSVKLAAHTLREKVISLDVLINNAGGIFGEKIITKDGFELTFSANHLGHFLLTELLLPALLKSGNSRIINVSSEAHRTAKVNFEDLQYRQKSYNSFIAYSNAKLFNILFTKSLVEKYGDKGLESFCLHPGVVKTNFAKENAGIFGLFWILGSPFMINPAQGARTSIFLAKTNSKELTSGAYFKKSKSVKPSTAANSKRMREILWQKSEEMVKNWLES
jgi:NAD(P)-dependent dehydrogenase (short-subunit alcohol dehydrogenase family)